MLFWHWHWKEVEKLSEHSKIRPKNIYKKNNFNKLKNCFFYSDIDKACKNADLIILHTEWDEFKSLNFNKLVQKKNFALYDLRNLYSFDEMRKKKIKYFSIGRPVFN